MNRTVPLLLLLLGCPAPALAPASAGGVCPDRGYAVVVCEDGAIVPDVLTSLERDWHLVVPDGYECSKAKPPTAVDETIRKAQRSVEQAREALIAPTKSR